MCALVGQIKDLILSTCTVQSWRYTVVFDGWLLVYFGYCTTTQWDELPLYNKICKCPETI